MFYGSDVTGDRFFVKFKKVQKWDELQKIVGKIPLIE